MEECKHEKLTEKSRAKSGPLTTIIQHCDGCNSDRNRVILSVQLDPNSDGRFGLVCFSDTAGPWVAST